MSEVSSSSSSLSAILALAARLERDTRFEVRDVYAHPYPFVEVKDTLHGVVVGFSTESDNVTYLEIIHTRRGGCRHA